jgi:hypothetical protein
MLGTEVELSAPRKKKQNIFENIKVERDKKLDAVKGLRIDESLEDLLTNVKLRLHYLKRVGIFSNSGIGLSKARISQKTLPLFNGLSDNFHHFSHKRKGNFKQLQEEKRKGAELAGEKMIPERPDLQMPRVPKTSLKPSKTEKVQILPSETESLTQGMFPNIQMPEAKVFDSHLSTPRQKSPLPKSSIKPNLDDINPLSTLSALSEANNPKIEEQLPEKMTSFTERKSEDVYILKPNVAKSQYTNISFQRNFPVVEKMSETASFNSPQSPKAMASPKELEEKKLLGKKMENVKVKNLVLKEADEIERHLNSDRKRKELMVKNMHEKSKEFFKENQKNFVGAIDKKISKGKIDIHQQIEEASLGLNEEEQLGSGVKSALDIIRGKLGDEYLQKISHKANPKKGKENSIIR